MSDRWLAVSVYPGRHREAAVRTLFGLGAQGLQERGDALMTQFPESVGATTIEDALRSAVPDSTIEIDAFVPENWASRWRESITSHVVGALVIAPPWLAANFDPRTTVVIEPAMAFGTGEHATTRGAIRLLSSLVRGGERVADLGAGSGALAIAAAKLGARTVAAIEIDPDAIENAELNVGANRVAAQVKVLEGDAAIFLPLVAPVDLITANIISSVLISLLPAMADALAPGGRAIVSGILASERGEFCAALHANGWRVVAEDAEDIWWTACIERS